MRRANDTQRFLTAALCGLLILIFFARSLQFGVAYAGPGFASCLSGVCPECGEKVQRI